MGALSVNTNISALGAGQQTKKSTGILTETLKQLASGKRINKAADDAAGLSIAELFRSQTVQANTEIGNLQSGINAVQTADGGLQVQQDAIGRLRELAVQAGNGTLSDDDRAAINAEAQQLKQQIDDTAQNTSFNGQNLLNSDTNIDLGAGGNQVDIAASNSTSLGINGLDLSTQAGAQAALGQLDDATDQLNQNRANLGAQQSGFESAIDQRQTASLNATESESNIRDLDIAKAIIQKTKGEILQKTGLAAIVQSSISSQSALRLLG